MHFLAVRSRKSHAFSTAVGQVSARRAISISEVEVNMHFLYCDESNLEHRAGDFLVYGGLIIPADRAASLTDTIRNMREDAGIAPDALVKFAPHVPPLNHARYRAFKQRMIEAAIEHHCLFIAYLVLHDLAGNPNAARRFGINTLCWHFHCIMIRMDDSGLVLIDRFNDDRNRADAQLREKMATGVALPHRDQPVQLNRIIGFHNSAIGQAHFTSLVDILVGSLRFAINAYCRNEPANQRGARNVLRLISPLFYRKRPRGPIPDLGLIFSPMNVRVQRYYDMYVGLQEFLRDRGVDSAQRITNHARG